uniref:Ycf34 n=1 Tax=Sebdenia flabellata TaxID=42024 RepID=A0A1C9C9V5_9FLOR|nr:hypothetical protein Sebd_071 [Sebdenia flabellata]AOM65158.1 hypothetical protein Sebd_071 [Sebdenia flabellata]
MCICVNCRHVHICTTYTLIQKQHDQNVKISTMNFIPTNTLIKINISQSKDYHMFDWDLKECLSFTEKPGNWLIKNE